MRNLLRSEVMRLKRKRRKTIKLKIIHQLFELIYRDERDRKELKLARID